MMTITIAILFLIPAAITAGAAVFWRRRYARYGENTAFFMSGLVATCAVLIAALGVFASLAIPAAVEIAGALL